MQRRLGVVLGICGCLMLAACDDGGTTPTDSRAPDQAQLDGAVPDGLVVDGPAVDGPAGEGQISDGQPLDQQLMDQAPVDGPPVVDAGPSALQVQIDKVVAWANLMPVVPPDPTHVTLTLKLTNGGTTPVSGIQLIDSAIQQVPTGTPQPIDLKAAGGFNGTVPAGQTVTADFTKVQKTTATPHPTCGATVKVGTTVSYTGGKVGPLWSGNVAFGCAY